MLVTSMTRPAATSVGAFDNPTLGGTMRRLVAGALSVVAALAVLPAGAAMVGDDGARPRDVLTMAVYGDSPYGTSPTDTSQTQATPTFIDSINADPDVSLVMHIGDIHSGKQFCTEDYDRHIFDLWQRFAEPLVYTPGDNEWTDCHKKAEGGGVYNPVTGQID